MVFFSTGKTSLQALFTNDYPYICIMNNAFGMDSYDVIVIGAGASGLLAAGRAAELGASVALLEKMDRPGRKLLITGKGRCNITNEAPLSDFIRNIYPNGRFLKHAFSAFFAPDIIGLLSRYGLTCVLERGGRYFPSTDKAKDVLEALLLWLKKGNVDILTNHKVEDLIINNNTIAGLNVATGNRRFQMNTKAVILSTGGRSYPATGSQGDGYRLATSAGHTIIKTRPALVPLETSGNIARQMQGLALKNVRASVWADGRKIVDDFGEMLFTHFGLSGPIILSLSRTVVDLLNDSRSPEIIVDLKPALDEKHLDNRLLRDLNEHGKKRMANILRLWLPAAMVPVIQNLSGIDPDKEGHQLTAAERKILLLLLKNLRFQITGYRSFKEAIITAGGVDTSEIHPRTMGSKLVSNLFITGELLDQDANTGGYNLQIAWSTGWLAGQSACKSVAE